jgi:16S rRNA (guanine1207-N2)-methyltransferase
MPAKRPRDVNSLAKRIVADATGEAEPQPEKPVKDASAVERGRKGRLKGRQGSGQEAPGQGTVRDRKIEVHLPGQRFELETRPGLFSHRVLDPGTGILLRTAPPPSGGNVLDLGCGYGPIAISVALRTPAATVWAVDVDDRALELTERNAVGLGLGNVKVASPRQVPTDERFACIYSNPPFRLARSEQRSLLANWLDRLIPDGTAYLVIKQNYGADRIQDWLTHHGYGAERFASKQGYRVILVRPSNSTHYRRASGG